MLYSGVVVRSTTSPAHLVTEADGQLADGKGMRAVGSEENLQLDGLVHVEAGRLELGFTLDCRREPGKIQCEYTKNTSHDIIKCWL